MNLGVRVSAHQDGNRRHRIAHEALLLLAEEGMRGLTHRRLDKRLGFPEGSVSVLFRRRIDLLEAVAREIARLDFVDFEDCFRPATERLALGEAVDLKLFAQCQYDVWRRFDQPDRRPRVPARLDGICDTRP